MVCVADNTTDSFARTATKVQLAVNITDEDIVIACIAHNANTVMIDSNGSVNIEVLYLGILAYYTKQSMIVADGVDGQICNGVSLSVELTLIHVVALPISYGVRPGFVGHVNISN